MKTLRRFRKPIAWLMVLLMATSLPGGPSFGADLYKSSNNIGLNQAPAYSQNLVPTATDTLVFGNQLTNATTFELLTSGTTFIAGTFTIGGLRFQNNMGGAVTFRPSNNLNNTLAVGAGGIDMSDANQNVTFTRTQGTGVLTLNTTTAQNWQVGSGRTLLIGADVSGNQAVTISGKTGSNESITQGGVVNFGGNNGATGLGALTVINSTVIVDHNVASQNKLNDTALVTLERSDLVVTGGSTITGTETIGGLRVNSGLSTLTRGSSQVVLGAGLLTKAVGGLLTFGAADIATTNSLNSNGILGAAYVINNTDWATKGAGNLVKALATYETSPDPFIWTAAKNVSVGTYIDTTGTGSQTINSLRFTAEVDLTKNVLAEGGDPILNLVSGGILKSANNPTTIAVGKITAGGTANGSADELVVWNNANTMTMDTTIVDNAGDMVHLTKAGVGVLLLSQTNTYTGITTIARGTLQLGNGLVTGDAGSLGTGTVVNDGTLLINKTVDSTIPNSMSGLGGLTKEVATNVTLSGTNTYAGITRVKGGSLLAGSTGGFSPNSIFTLLGTATLNANGFNTTVGALASSSVGTLVSLGANTLTIAGSNDSGQTLFGTISGSGGLVKNGAGFQTLSGGGTLSYTGTTVVNGGTLRVDKIMGTSGLTVNGGTFISNASNILPDTAPVNLAGSSAVWTINNGFTETIKGLSSAVGSLLNLGTGTTTTGVSLTVNDNGGVPTIANGAITGVDATLIKNGTNGLTLGGGNSFNGPLTINNGIVTLTVAPTTPNLSGVLNDRVDVGIANLATAGLALGSNETIGSLNGGGALGGNLAVGTFTLTTGLSNTNDTFAGQITGPAGGIGGLRKVGSAAMTLTNTSTFTGLTTLQDGTLNLSAVGGNTLAAASRMTVVGNGSLLNVNSSQSFSALSGGYGTTISLNGAATNLTITPAPAVTVAVAIAGTATLTDVLTLTSTSGLVPGMLVTGTNIPANAEVVQVLSPTTVQLSFRIGTTAPAGNANIVFSTPNSLASVLTGNGNLIVTGTGPTATQTLLSKATYTGDTTVNVGTLILGGERIHSNVLPATTDVNVATGATLSIMPSTANLRSYQALTTLTGGGTVQLLNGTNSGALVIGVGDASSSFTGNISGGAGTDTATMKVGSGTFTWTNAAGNVHDGLIRIENGTLATAGAGGLDANNIVVLSNKTGAIYNPQSTDTIKSLSGGAHVAGLVPNSLAGTADTASLGGNFLNAGAGDTGGVVNIGTGVTLTLNTGAGTRQFGGNIIGPGLLIKAGSYIQEFLGNVNSTGSISVTAGTLRLGTYGAATGVGAVAVGGQGALATTSNLIVTGGTTNFDVNGANMTLNSLTSTGNVLLQNGNLTISTTTGASGAFSGVISGTGDVNVSATLGAGGWTLSGANTFTGLLNITGSTTTVTSNRTGGAIADTARVNVGTGATLIITLADTIGGLSGSGALTLTQSLTLLDARGGTYSGSSTGAGGLTLDGLGSLRLASDQGFAGTTTVNRGAILTLDYGTGAINIVPAALVLGGGTLQITGATSVDVATSTALTASSATIGGGNIVRGAIGSSPLGLGAITRGAGTTLSIFNGGAATSTANVSSIIGGYAVANGTSWAVANGATTAISGLLDASYTANSWNNTATTNTDVTTGIAAATGAVNSVRFNTAAANVVTLTGNSSIASGGVLVTPNVGAFDSTITTGGGFTLTGGAAGGVVLNEVVLHNHNILGNLFIHVPIVNNAAATRLTTAGLGRTILTQANTFTGIVTITEGVLQVGNNGITGDLGTSPNIINDGILSIKRAAVASGGAADLTLTQIISGRGWFRQDGPGVTRLGGANTYTGRTTVASGTLQVNSSTALGTSLGVAGASSGPLGNFAGLTSVQSGAILDIVAASAAIIAEPIELNGILRDSSLSGNTHQITGNLFLTADGTVNVVTTGDILRLSGAVFGSPDQSAAAGLQPAGLTISGLGTARLEGAGIYTGSTTINTGATLQVGNAGTTGSLGTGPVIANGTLSLNRSDAVRHFSKTLTGSGIFEKLGNTATILSGNINGFTGTYRTTAGSTGALTFGDNNFLSANTLPGAKQVTATATEVFLRHTYQNDVMTDTGIYTLTPSTTLNARVFKGGLGLLNLTAQARGQIASGNTGRSIFDVADGVLRLSGGLTDLTGTVNTANAFTGDFNITNTRNYNNNTGSSFVEFAGSSDIFFGGRFITGNGPLIQNSTGTVTFNQAATITQSNTDVRGLLGYKGTIVFNAAATGDAWKDTDGFIALAGSQLSVLANETVGMIGSLPVSTTTIATGVTLTINGNNNQNNRSGVLAGKITGPGNLVLNGSGNFAKTMLLSNETNDFGTALDLAITYSQVQGTSLSNKGLPSSIGAGDRIVLNPNHATEVQLAAFTYVGQTAAGHSSNRDVGLDGVVNANVSVLTSNTSSPTVTVASVPVSLVVGSSLLGQTVTGISGNTITLGGNANQIITSATNAAYIGASTMIRAIVANGAGPLTMSGTVSNIAAGPARTLHFDGVSTRANTYSGLIADGAAGLNLIKRGTGVWSLTNANTYTGTTQIQDGILRINSFAAVNGSNIASALRIGNGGTGGTFEYAGPGETTTKAIDFAATTGSPRFVNIGAGALTLNGTLAFGAGDKTILLGRYDDTPGFVNTFTAPFTDQASGVVTGIQKEGRSSWYLAGANTFTSTITVVEGTLRIANPVTGARRLNMNNTYGRGAILQLDGNASFDQVGGPNGFQGLGNEIQLTGGNTFTFNGTQVGNNNNAGNSNYWNGNILGNGSVIKNSNAAGDQVALMGFFSQVFPNNGLNSFTGSMTINSARVDVMVLANGGQASGIGAGSAANTQLVLNGNTDDDGLRYIGITARTTDRLLSLGAAPAGKSNPDGIWADGARIGGMEESTIKFTGTGAIGYVGSGSRVLTLRGGNVGDNEFNMAIGDGAGGSTALNKVEGSTWVLGGNSNYTGAVTVSGGILSVTHNNALGTSAGGVNVNGGGGTILELQGGVTISGEAFTFGANDAGLASSAGSNAWTGQVAVNNNARFIVLQGSTLTHSGTMITDGDGAALMKVEPGTLVFAGDNTGMTNLNNDLTLAGGKLVLDYTGGGNQALSKLADTGDLVFGGTGNVSSVNIGSNSAALRQSFQAAATLELTGGAHVEVVNFTTINSGQHSLIRTGGTSVLRMNGLGRNIGGTIDFGTASIAQTDNNNTNSILGGWATLGHTNWAQSINTGAADTAITPIGAYTTNGYANANANVDVTIPNSPATFTTTVNSLRFNTATGSTLTLTGDNRVLSGGILITPAVTSPFTLFTGAGTITAGGTNASTDLIIHNWSGNTVTLDAVVANNGTGTTSFTMSGDGDIVLTKTNSYAGTTTINSSTLRVGIGGTTGSMGNGQGSVVNNGTLILDANRTFTHTGTISGNGGLIMQMGDITFGGGNSYHGETVINGGTLTLSNGGGLGTTIGRTTLNNNARLNISNSQNSGEYLIINPGMGQSITLGSLVQGNSTFSGRLDFNNTTPAGAIVDVVHDASGTALTLSGIIRSTAGFTKTGTGTLRINNSNWINGAPTLMGQLNITAGTLWAENGRTLGGTGPGNETIIANGASLEIRGQNFAFGDDATATREIFRLAGTGVGNVGALRSTAGNDARVLNLELSGNTTVGGGGSMLQSFFDSSGLREFRRDGYASNDQNNTGDIMRLRLIRADRDITNGSANNLGPTLTSFGGTFSLTKIGIIEVELRDTALTNLNKIIVNEGELRLLDELSNTSFTAPAINPYVLNDEQGTSRSVLNVAQVAGVEVVYTGPTPSLRGIQGSATLAVDAGILNPLTGARLDLYRQHLTQHTTPVTAFGSSGALGNIHNNSSIEVSSDTLAYSWTKLGGKITLTGMASGANTFFNVEGGGFGTNNVDGVLGTRTPAGGFFVNPGSILVVSGDGTTPAMTGTGGFTKIGARELRLTGSTNFTGDTVITRSTNTGVLLDPSQPGSRVAFAGGLTLYGAGAGTVGGTLGSTANIVLDRLGLLRVDNTNDLDASSFGVLGGNNNNRINDSANIIYKNGIIIFDNEAASTETVGAIQVQRGNNYLAFNLAAGSGNTTLTAASITRSPGAILSISDWNVDSTFSTNTTGDSLKIILGDSGASLGLVGTGTTPNTTDLRVAPGIFGGKLPFSQSMTTETRPDDPITQFRNNFFAAGRDFMTVEGNVLRPLDDDEYSSTLTAGQNVNLSGLHTSLLSSVNVNSLRLGNLGDYDASGAVAGTGLANIQATPVELTLSDNSTLGLASGMILSAPFGVAQRNTLTTYINGGTIDAGSKELILHNVNLSYRLQDGTYEGFNMEVRSALAGTGGLTKSGFQQVVLDGRNTYSGVTSVEEGTLYLRSSMALGAGRTLAQATGTNGIVVENSGSFFYATGINIGSTLGVQSLDAHYEDLAIRTLNGDTRIAMRSDGQVNRFNGDIVADLVDASGHTLFGDNRVNVNSNSAMILTGDIYGGASPVSNDEYITDARILTTNGSSNGFILFKGQFGDRSDGMGGATTIAYNPSLFASDGSTRTHQNEVMRLWIGGNVELNFNSYQPWNAVGRLEMTGGYLRYVGTGNFYTADAAAKINSVLGSELLPMVGFQLGIGTNQSNTGTAPVGDMAAILLTKPGQAFNITNFVVGNTGGAALIGGENESGVVTFGTGDGTILQTRTTRYFSAAGGRVDINSRILSSSIDKGGRGEVVMTGAPIGGGSAGSVNVQGGQLTLDYGVNNNTRYATSANLSLSGGTLLFRGFNGLVPANTTQGTAQRGDAGSSFNVNNGGSELIVEGRGGSVMTLNIGTGPINSTNTSTTVINRAPGGTINFVEMNDGLVGSAGVITLLARSGLVQNVAIPHATYGTAPRTAIDFAMDDDTTDGIGAYLRVSDEYKNDITTWQTSEDISENGGAGFIGTLVPKIVATNPQTYPTGNTHHRVVNTLRFDANAESAISLGPDEKLIVGSGGIMTTTAVGTSNKTIAGGTTTNVFLTSAASTTTGSNLVTGVSTTGFYAGMRVSNFGAGTGIPTGAYITTIIDGNSFELSTKATATVAATNSVVIAKEGGLTSTVYSTVEGTTTNGSNVVSGLDTTDLFPGLRIAGTNIPAGSFVSSIVDATTVTISNNATGDSVGTATVDLGAAELIFHHYAQGALNVASQIVGTNAVVVTGPSVTSASSLAAWSSSSTSQVVFSGNNNYTGKTYIGGSILSIDSAARLGPNPTAATDGQLYLNGGALRWTGGSEALGSNRRTQIGGNGGVFDVVNGNTVLSLNALVASETSGSVHAVGDIVKMGAGVLDLTTDSGNFNGLIDVRQGTLRATSTSTGTTSIFGTNRSAIDGTVLRNGTRLELWNSVSAGDYIWEEWFKFEGNNTVQIGQPGQATQRIANLNGVIELQGNVTFDVTAAAVARLNNAGGYLTGTGSINKIGQGILEFRDNNVEWSGQLTIQEGSVLLSSNGRPAGMSTLPIVLGGTEYQGLADLRLQNENALPGSYVEVFQNIDVTYNPLQTKRIQILSPQHNGQDHYFYGNITMNDNLSVHTSDATLVSGGKFDFTHFKGNFVDGATSTGNLLFHTDESNSGTANDQRNGGVWGYNVLSGDNSGWSGDVTVGINTTYDRDEITIVRLDHNNALTAKNDVTLNGSSVLQAAGRTVTIGGLSTPGAIGEFGNSNFTGAVIENAAATPGTLTITQTTPANTEVIMSATIRDGLPPDHMYQTNGQAGAALNIVKDGAGWITLTQDNQQTGSLLIKAGTLQVGVNGFGDTGANTTAGNIVQNGATLAGTGHVNGATTIELGATVKPGDVAGSIMGTLVMNGDAAFLAGSTLAMQISKATFNAPELNSAMQANYAAIISSLTTTYAGTLASPVLTTQHDHLDINGTATFAAGSKVAVSFFGGYTPMAGDIINLIDWMNISAAGFNVGINPRNGGELGTDLDLPSLANNLIYDTTLFKTDGVLVIVLAPEPSRALLLAFGLLGLLLRRRRR